MQTSHHDTVSGQALDNLLKQAFLNLDVTNPKNDAIMETVANTTFINPAAPGAGTWRSFFSAKMIIIAGISLLTLISLAVYFLTANNTLQEKAVHETTSYDAAIGSEKVAGAEAKHDIGGESEAQKKPAAKPAKALSVAVSGTQPQPLWTYEENFPEQKPVPYIPEQRSKTEDSSYVFPVLTAGEIKANHRQKKKMIDQLSKFSKDHYAYIPMGSFLYGKDTFSCQSFYMQRTEVSNLEYRTFLFDLLIAGKKKEFLKAKPDQAQWIEKFNDGANLEPMKLNYFSHPAYNDYPVVNISREGAEMYCIWLTIAANQKLKEKNKPLINDLRMPMDYEWAYAANNGKYRVRYANGWQYLRDRRGLYIQNFNGAEYAQCRHDTVHDLYLYQSTREKEVKPADDGGFLTTKAASYAPNAYGLYDMAGNVSEMVYMNHIRDRRPSGFGSKGGSWMSPDYFLEIDAAQEFRHPEKPSPFIGFRPVVTAVLIKTIR